MSDKGPRVTLHISCLNCEYEHSERYRVQGDSGTDVSCTHSAGRGRVGVSTWNTPSWCPLRAAALEAFLAEVKP